MDNAPYLSSGPPSFLTIFRNENTVPNMSFASSLALNLAGRALAGPRSGGGAPLIDTFGSDIGRFVVPESEGGRS
jgi:hypothetical protein